MSLNASSLSVDLPRGPLARWAGLVARHRRVVLLAFGVVSGCALIVALDRLHLDFEVVGMLPEGRPAYDDFKAFVSDFGQLDRLAIVLESPDPDALPAFADALTSNLEGLDTVGRVHARVDAERIAGELLGRYLYSYLEAADYDELAARIGAEAIDARVRGYRTALALPLELRSARVIADDPLQLRALAGDHIARVMTGSATTDARGHLRSPDRRALLLTIEPTRSAFEVQFARMLLDDVDAAIARARSALAPSAAARPGAQGAQGAKVTAIVAGAYFFALEDAATLRTDLRRYGVLALLGVLAAFAVGYHSLALLLYVAVPLVITSLLTFGVSLLLFDQLNAASLCFAAILYGLSIDTAVHFYTRLLQEGRRRAPADAVAATLIGLRRAHVAASLTTTAVFALIGLSDLAAVRQLGVLTAAGMLFNLLEFFTLYPALGLVLLSRSRPLQWSSLHSPLAERAAQFAARRRRLIVLGAALAALALLPLAASVSVEPSLDRLRPADSPAAAAQSMVAERFGTDGWSGAVLIRRADAQSALAAAEDVERRLRALLDDGVLVEVAGVGHLLPSERRQRARLDRLAALPRAEAAAHMRAALAAHGFVAAAFEPFLEDFVEGPHELVMPGAPELGPLAPLIERHLRRVGTDHIVAIYLRRSPRIKATELSDRMQAALSGIPFVFASRALLEEELGRRLRLETAWFCTAAVAADVIVVTAILRSVRAAAAVVLPALLVLELMLAGMAAAGMPLGPVAILAFPLVLGLSVDDGLYVLEAGRERGDWPAALRHCGRALIVTSLTTITGFGFLVLSRYPVLADLGVLAGLGLSLCFASSVILVPSVMATLTPGAPPDPR